MPSACSVLSPSRRFLLLAAVFLVGALMGAYLAHALAPAASLPGATCPMMAPPPASAPVAVVTQEPVESVEIAEQEQPGSEPGPTKVAEVPEASEVTEAADVPEANEFETI